MGNRKRNTTTMLKAVSHASVSETMECQRSSMRSRANAPYTLFGESPTRPSMTFFCATPARFSLGSRHRQIHSRCLNRNSHRCRSSTTAVNAGYASGIPSSPRCVDFDEKICWRRRVRGAPNRRRRSGREKMVLDAEWWRRQTT